MKFTTQKRGKVHCNNTYTLELILAINVLFIQSKVGKCTCSYISPFTHFCLYKTINSFKCLCFVTVQEQYLPSDIFVISTERQLISRHDVKCQTDSFTVLMKEVITRLINFDQLQLIANLDNYNLLFVSHLSPQKQYKNLVCQFL